MAMAKVERWHREAAHLAMYGQARDLRPGAPGDGSIVSRWLVGDPLSLKEMRAVEQHQRTAQAIAKARAEGEAAGRASAAVAVEAEADRLCASGNKTKGLIAGALYHVANVVRAGDTAGKESSNG